jgi:hypothetical protein
MADYNSTYTGAQVDANLALAATAVQPSAIGVTIQAYDAQLADIAGLTATDNGVVIGNGTNFVVESGAALKASLGLTIGTNVQAYDSQLDDIAGLTPTDNGVVIGNGTNFVVESGATLKASLGLTIGTDVQAYDADLAAIAGLTSAANKLPMFSGSGTATVIDFLDEDNMASNSATAVPSQQSVKAYVDAAGGGGAFTADADTRITATTPIALNNATGNEVALTIAYTVNKATSGNDTGLLISMTDTASPGTSLPLDIQVGGSSKLSFTNDAVLNVNTAGSQGIRLLGYAAVTNGFGMCTFNLTPALFVNNVAVLTATSGGYALVPSTGGYAWNSGTLSGAASPDLILERDAANVLAQRNGTTAQEARDYRTYTDSSNYQRLARRFSTSTALIHNEGAGTGADGSIAFNDAALATAATKGFVMIPSCAGAPTGVPADIPTGQIPLVFDSTNNKLYAYDGGWLSTAALT